MITVAKTMNFDRFQINLFRQQDKFYANLVRKFDLMPWQGSRYRFQEDSNESEMNIRFKIIKEVKKKPYFVTKFKVTT